MQDLNYYCINLESAVARRQRIEELARKASIQVQFIRAIEGETITPAKTACYDRKRRLRYMRDMEPNEIACTLSHKLALQAFLDDPFPFAVIMEDDATFGETVAHDISRLIQQIRGFDLLKLESRDSRGLTLGEIEGRRIFLPLKASNGTTAILYTKQGAQRLIAGLERFHHPIDTHIGFAWGMGILSAACWPPLITEDTRQSSTIRGRAESKRLQGIGPWFISRTERMTHSVMKRLFFLFVGKKRVTVGSPPASASTQTAN